MQVLSIWLWRRSDPGAKRNAQVAGYRYVQEWPPAVCSVNSRLCHGIVQRFTIHGLWPFDSNGRSITGCVGSAYNVSLVSSFLAKLNYSWPSYDNRPYRYLWEHEWDVHGKCSETILSQVKYFNNSVNLYSGFNLLSRLQSQGINPDNKGYKVQDILNAFPTVVQVNCKTNSAVKVLLYEIFICIDLRGQATNCTGASQINCGGTQANITFLA